MSSGRPGFRVPWHERRAMSAPLNHVSAVVAWRPDVQMAGIAAGRVVAVVERPLVTRKLSPELDLQHDAVCPSSTMPEAELAVSVAIPVARPGPACARLAALDVDPDAVLPIVVRSQGCVKAAPRTVARVPLSNLRRVSQETTTAGCACPLDAGSPRGVTASAGAVLASCSQVRTADYRPRPADGAGHAEIRTLRGHREASLPGVTPSAVPPARGHFHIYCTIYMGAG